MEFDFAAANSLLTSGSAVAPAPRNWRQFMPPPAIVTEMDSTTLVLPEHSAVVHASGSLLINPVEG